ncbi:unnamed protein product, partial [Pylaiella littoralis]
EIGGASIAVTGEIQYELFFMVDDFAQATGFELTIMGQLNGANWNVEIFDFVSAGTYENIGTLAVTAASSGEVTVTFPTSTPANYIDSTIDPADTIPEVLIRLTGAAGETGTLDFAAVAATAGAPAPTPAPVVG